MQQAVFLMFFLAAAGELTAVENYNDTMSVAQKEGPGRGRILMPRISKTNGEPPEKQLLTDAVALVTGGGGGIGSAIARQLAVLGAAVSICGRDRAALEESARSLAKIRRRGHAPAADVTK